MKFTASLNSKPRLHARNNSLKTVRKCVVVTRCAAACLLLNVLIRKFAFTDKVGPFAEGTVGMRLAFVHELIPEVDQGGNIRALRVLEDIVRAGISVDLFSRTSSEAKKQSSSTFTSFSVSGVDILLFEDDVDLTIFKSRKENYDAVVSTMWFWRKFHSRSVHSIPYTVFQARDFGVERHFTLTDDIHYKRCALTRPRHLQQVCADIQSEEEFIWQRDSIFKIFVSAEDRAFVAMHHFANSKYLHFLAWPVRYDPVSQSATKCKLVYFGTTHDANVAAVNAMFSNLPHTTVTSRRIERCALNIYGDGGWFAAIPRSSLNSAHRFGIDVEIKGKVSSSQLRSEISSATLAVIPVTVGGTGVTSKVLMAIEFAMPFLSSPEGRRGLNCDNFCAGRFFATSPEKMLIEALALVSDNDALVEHKRFVVKLLDQNVNDSNFGRYVLDGLWPSIGAPSSKTEKFNSLYVHRHCKKCVAPHSACVFVCNIFSSRLEDPRISVYTSLKGSREEAIYIDDFVHNVLSQDVEVNWEWVVGCADEQTIRRFSVSVRKHNLPRGLKVSLVLLREDRGLYETWDYLIQYHTAGAFLTNWNVDDRKHPRSIQVRYEKLTQLKDEVILISSPVFVSTSTIQDWATAPKTTVWFPQPGIYALSNFMNDVDGKDPWFTNYPHNSPLYARVAHENYGYFADGYANAQAPTCSDYRFWIKVANGGEWFFHLDLAFDVYLLRQESHEHSHDAKACLLGISHHDDLLINNELHHHWLPGAYARRLLIVLHANFADAYTRTAIKLVIDKLTANAHIVDVIALTGNIRDIVQEESKLFRHVKLLDTIPFVCYDILVGTDFFPHTFANSLPCSSPVLRSIPQYGGKRAMDRFMKELFQVLDPER